jgi:signal transduction histidine kinase
MTTTKTSDLLSNFPEHEELVYLRDFREKILQFLHILCNYDIKTPAGHIRAYTELMLRLPNFNHQPQRNLKVIHRASQDIVDVIDTVIAMAYLEREPERLREFQSHAEVDLKGILERHILYAHKCIEEDNEDFHHARELAKTNSNFIIGHDIIATNLVVSIPDHLPKAYGDEQMVDQIVELLTKIAVKYPLKRDVRYDAQFDDNSITTTISWTGTGREEHLLDMFHQFASARTGFAFSERGLGLYLSWRLTQLQSGQLHFEIRDQTTHVMTLTLPCAAQQALPPDAATRP